MSESNGFAQQVVSIATRLIACRQQLVCAESCTGGWIAKLLTDQPGSSNWFMGGVVAYSNQIKQQLLGVDPHTLNHHGAVSLETATQMAQGAARLGSASVSLAVTGIAGPAGGSPSKPVGTVCFAWLVNDSIVAHQLRFHGDRDAIRRASVSHSLERLLACL